MDHSQMISMSKCINRGIKVEAVPQSSGRFPKCKIQVTRNGETKIGERLYNQKGGELNEQIELIYKHYASQLK